MLDEFERMINARDNQNGYVLNTSTGVLHTQECGDGQTGLAPVSKEHRKFYQNYYIAINDMNYKSDHTLCLM